MDLRALDQVDLGEIRDRTGRRPIVDRLDLGKIGDCVHTEISLWAFRAEALGALGRTDEALQALLHLSEGPLRVEEDWHHFQAPRILRAKLDIDRGELGAAVDRLLAAAHTVTVGDERSAFGMQIAALLGTAAQHLGDPETAAQCFGHAAAERDRLDIVLRPSQRHLVESAVDACREALGANRFEELASLGARL